MRHAILFRHDGCKIINLEALFVAPLLARVGEIETFAPPSRIAHRTRNEAQLADSFRVTAFPFFCAAPALLTTFRSPNVPLQSTSTLDTSDLRLGASGSRCRHPSDVTPGSIRLPSLASILLHPSVTRHRAFPASRSFFSICAIPSSNPVMFRGAPLHFLWKLLRCSTSAVVPRMVSSGPPPSSICVLAPCLLCTSCFFQALASAHSLLLRHGALHPPLPCLDAHRAA